MNKDLEKYNQFYLGYNPFLKEGVVTTDDFKERVSSQLFFSNFVRLKSVMLQEEIAHLLRFEAASTKEGVTLSLAEYVKNMPEDQKEIFYIASPR